MILPHKRNATNSTKTNTRTVVRHTSIFKSPSLWCEMLHKGFPQLSHWHPCTARSRHRQTCSLRQLAHFIPHRISHHSSQPLQSSAAGIHAQLLQLGCPTTICICTLLACHCLQNILYTNNGAIGIVSTTFITRSFITACCHNTRKTTSNLHPIRPLHHLLAQPPRDHSGHVANLLPSQTFLVEAKKVTTYSSHATIAFLNQNSTHQAYSHFQHSATHNATCKQHVAQNEIWVLDLHLANLQILRRNAT